MVRPSRPIRRIPRTPVVMPLKFPPRPKNYIPEKIDADYSPEIETIRLYLVQLENEETLKALLESQDKRIEFQQNSTPEKYDGISAISLSGKGLELKYGPHYLPATTENCIDYIDQLSRKTKKQIDLERVRKEVLGGFEKLLK